MHKLFAFGVPIIFYHPSSRHSNQVEDFCAPYYKLFENKTEKSIEQNRWRTIDDRCNNTVMIEIEIKILVINNTSKTNTIINIIMKNNRLKDTSR